MWGWWINRLDSSCKIENLKICLYTNSVDSIQEDVSIKVGNVTYNSKLVEVAHDQDRDNGVKEKGRVKSQELLRNNVIEHRVEEREEMDFGDRESEASMDEVKVNSSSLISRVSDSVVKNEGRNNSLSKISSSKGQN